jgi:signal peptidase I
MIVFSAAIVLLLTLLFPVFKIQRGSMAPSLNDGDIAVFITAGKIRHGDIIAFHHGNNVLIKRVIAVSGDWVEISGDGAVTLNGVPLDDSYADGYGSGDELSAQIPDKHFFVLGDQRRMSLDSRSEEIGVIPQEHIIGKHLLRIWPLKRRG